MIIMLTAKGGVSPTISTVGDNGHFLQGEEGSGQQCGLLRRCARTEDMSSFHLVLASGTAGQEDFLLMCLYSLKGGLYAVAS